MSFVRCTCRFIDLLKSQTLLNTIKRWSWAFQKHELEHLIDTLNELEDFITKADEGLEIELVEGDYDNLIK